MIDTGTCPRVVLCKPFHSEYSNPLTNPALNSQAARRTIFSRIIAAGDLSDFVESPGGANKVVLSIRFS